MLKNSIMRRRTSWKPTSNTSGGFDHPHQIKVKDTMLKNHKYSVTFPTNGITLDGAFSLEPGSTAITGPNGSGKTFGSLEIWRYLLFGKEALRGPASDYKSLNAEGTCTIGGQDYTIVRHAKKETITDSDGQVLAVNASAVTHKVRDLLGFNLAVFDVVCCSVQKDKSGFSDLLPTARKKLIDDIVGLSSQEQVEKDCKAEAKTHRMTASVLLDGHSKPVEPEKPDGYQPSADLEGLIAIAKEYETAKAKLVAEEAPPERPDRDRPADGRIKELEAQVDDLNQHRRLMAEHDAIDAPEYSADTLDAAEAFAAFEAEKDKRGSAPQHSADYLEHQEHLLALATFGDLEVDCPKCGHQFTPGTSETAEISKSDISADRRAHVLWETPLVDVGAPAVLLTPRQIADGRQALLDQNRAVQLLEQASKIILCPESINELEQARKDQMGMDIFDALWDKWNTRNTARVLDLDQFNQMAVPDIGADVLHEKLVEARVYETELKNYETQLQTYTDRNDRILEAEKLAKDYSEGAIALSETRMAIKAFLAPSLSRVASALISEMTAGKLDTVIVDEEMNVTVNGQDITTLSGAGTTVANLALRIALGQVLVSTVFSVFIGDELDKDMDPERSAATAEALARLSGHLDQLILITHKDVGFADHQIIHTNQ